MEAEATFTVQQVAATAIMLYLCMSFSTDQNESNRRLLRSYMCAVADRKKSAPFAVDMISRIF